MKINFIKVFFILLLLSITIFFSFAKKPKFTIEAENMELSGGYSIEKEGWIKGLIDIRIFPFLPKAETGYAKYLFNNEEGIYDIMIYYFDENDGKCTFNIYLNEKKIDSWIPDKDLGDKHPVQKTLQIREINNLELKSNDTLTIEGIADVTNSSFAELARVDKIEFYYKRRLIKK